MIAPYLLQKWRMQMSNTRDVSLNPCGVANERKFREDNRVPHLFFPHCGHTDVLEFTDKCYGITFASVYCFKTLD